MDGDGFVSLEDFRNMMDPSVVAAAAPGGGPSHRPRQQSVLKF